MLGIKKTISSASLSNDIDKLTSDFTNLVTNLLQKAKQADEAKTAIEQTISDLQVESNSLSLISSHAKNIASKISNIFSVNNTDCV